MKNIGVLGLDSSKDFANSTVRPSTYLLPNFSSINALKYFYFVFNFMFILRKQFELL